MCVCKCFYIVTLVALCTCMTSPEIKFIPIDVELMSSYFQVKKDGRFYKFVKKHILQRKTHSNDVQEIHIVPDGEEFRWARRSAGSAASRSSNGTSSSEGDRLETVHDMAEEYVDDLDDV